MSTIRDVAALAGYSPATVSRVINHDKTYKITDEAREKIWRAVAELNYKARSNSGQQFKNVKANKKGNESYTFGCIINVQGGKYADPYYLAVLSGFEEVMQEMGHGMTFVHTNEEFNNRNVMYNAFDEPPTGLIIMNTLPDDVYSFISKKTPHIVGVDTQYSNIDNVANDHYTCAHMAVEHLKDQGYKRIGFIGGFKDHIVGSGRFQGYYAALYQYGLPYDPKWVLPSNWTDEYCVQMVKEAYKRGDLPDAYFVASDLMAIATLRALYDLGVSVPGECAVMGVSNIEIAKYSNPPLSTVAIPIKDMGRVAARALLARIEGDESPCKVITLGLEVLKRSST